MAEAIISTAYDHRNDECRYCWGKGDPITDVIEHDSECPITLAQKVLADF